ncbi:MAG: hypothetical protein M3Y68_05905, partial [Chloroflexota bacterium]|nr:hypothetical protein [Chloroflexota bacterium]
MANTSSPVNKAKKRGKSRKVSNHRSARNTEIISRIRELAWAGQHVEAIELATQELRRSNLQPDVQIGLLDLRAESYGALGKFELANQDARAMVNLAAASKKPTLKAQALNRKA